MNLKRHHVLSELTGVTGMAIVRDILAGVRDPRVGGPSRRPQGQRSRDCGGADRPLSCRTSVRAARTSRRLNSISTKLPSATKPPQLNSPAWRILAHLPQASCRRPDRVPSSAKTNRARSCSRRSIALSEVPTSAKMISVRKTLVVLAGSIYFTLINKPPLRFNRIYHATLGLGYPRNMTVRQLVARQSAP